MTAATATRSPFDALDQFGAETDEMGERFAAVATPVAAPVVHCLGGCGRVLTSPASITRGYGKTCFRNAKRRAEALGPEFSDRQVETIVEAIEDGAIVPSTEAGVFYVVGSAGDEIYMTTREACTCKAFTAHAPEHRRMCWHRGLVAAVSA